LIIFRTSDALFAIRKPFPVILARRTLAPLMKFKNFRAT